MSRSTDPGHFFQTDSALSESARKAAKAKNTHGNPLSLPSKILAITRDPHDAALVYVAEAAGTVKHVRPGDADESGEKGKVLATFSGPQAPVTSVAVAKDAVFAGCWDKTIWCWDLATRKVKRRFAGHADFVKAVVILAGPSATLLVSGSADASIIVWDAGSGAKLHVLKGHTRGVLALALDPATCRSEADDVVIFSAGSDREIRRWKVGASAAAEIQDDAAPIIAHETSVDALRFDADGDLWTASADKSAKGLARERAWEEHTSFEHPDYVRDVVVDDEGGWVVTACRDEEVRVWQRGSGKLHHVFGGHFEEVTGLSLLAGQKVVSVSIDGTVRTWSLKARDLARAVQEAEDERVGKVKEVEEEKKEGVLTAEEEAELAALMEDGDEE